MCLEGIYKFKIPTLNFYDNTQIDISGNIYEDCYQIASLTFLLFFHWIILLTIPVCFSAFFRKLPAPADLFYYVVSSINNSW